MTVAVALGLLPILVSCASDPLGRRNLEMPSRMQAFTAEAPLPVVGRTAAGQDIHLGGFSGLLFLGRKDDRLMFMTHTDRGPNPKPDGNRRPFALPGFQPEWITLAADERTGRYQVIERRPLHGIDGSPLSGLPPSQGHQEQPVDLQGRTLKADSDGMDAEALAPHPDGGFWMADEYGPSLIRFDTEGREVERLSPGEGLPASYAHRPINRGFEGLAFAKGRLYAFLQSPLPGEQPRGRILELDPHTRQTREFGYPFESENTRIGDASGLPDGRLLVIERDEKTGPKARKLVFRLTLGESGSIARKEQIADLAKLGFPYEKAEGLAVLDDGRLAVVHDNDFNIDGPTEQSPGRFPTKNESPQIFLFHPEVSL